MEKSYEKYPPHLIQTILQQYDPGVRGHGFLALAKKYNIKGGPKSISDWYSKWDGSESSLKKRSGGDRRSILTQKEKKKHVADFIEKSSKKEAVIYSEVKKNVEKKTKKSPALRTVQDYGKSYNITSKKRKRVLKSEGIFLAVVYHFASRYVIRTFLQVPSLILCVVGTEAYRNSVVEIRKKLSRVAKKRLVFMDGSGMRSEPRPLKGLAPAGQTPKTTAEKPEKYEPRVDIMGAVGYNGPLACETKTSSQRRVIPNPKKGKTGVKGYTKPMVKDFIRSELAPKIMEIKVKDVVVVMDKGLSFKAEEAKKQFTAGEAKNVKNVLILPTNTAKYVSPLDNTLWHSLKERVRARKPKTEAGTARILKEEFMGINQTDIQNYFTKCKLSWRSAPSEDL